MTQSLEVKFSLNQIGLAVDYRTNPAEEWRGLDLYKLKQPCDAGKAADAFLAGAVKQGIPVKEHSRNF